MPGVFSWPGTIPAGQVISKVASALDLFPTLARTAGAALPTDRSYPGTDLTALLRGSNAQHDLPSRPFFYHFGFQLQAVREA